jgi:CBS-domain-containing membrane protein
MILVPLSAVRQTFLYILQSTTMRSMILVPLSAVHQTFLYILQPITMRSMFLVPLSIVHQTFLYILQPTTMRSMILVPLSIVHQSILKTRQMCKIQWIHHITVSSKLQCQDLILMCTCRTLYCQHAVVISCFTLCSLL